MRKYFIITILSTVFAVKLFAQQSDTGNWFIYFITSHSLKKMELHDEVQYRNYNIAGDSQQLLLRTGIDYYLTENNNNILLGYGYIHSQNYLANKTEKVSTNEHRIFQQFINRQNIGKVFLLHQSG